MLAALKSENAVQAFSCEFCEIFKNNFLKSTSYRCFWMENKYNNTKIKRKIIKHNYFLAQPSSLRKAFLIKRSPWLLLDIYTISKFALFNFFHIESANGSVLYEKLFLNFWLFTVKHLCWSLFLIKFKAEGLQLY